VANGSLTALQLDAAAGLLQNQGIGISASLTQAIAQYQDTALISPFLNTIQVGSANALSAGVIANLETLAANTCSAFSNSIPPAYSSLGVQMTDVVLAQAAVDICDNNVSKLTQAVNQAQGYAEQTSIFINSAVNSQQYLGNTFTSINNMITGSIGTINLVTTTFGSDLQNLGQLINLRNLDNFGTPLALVQQLFSVAGTVPILSVAFVNAGIAEEVVLNLTNPTASVTDSIQRAMYQAMTQITGSDLSQLLQVLGVTTVGIQTVADLLNPLKLFPNSFQSLTTPTANGPVAVYVDSTGSINTQLTQLLPPYVVSSLV
jgi:type III secretory pathway component EscS